MLQAEGTVGAKTLIYNRASSLEKRQEGLGWECIKGGWKSGRQQIFGAFWAIIKALDFILQAMEDQGKFGCDHACHVENRLLGCKE